MGHISLFISKIHLEIENSSSERSYLLRNVRGKGPSALEGTERVVATRRFGQGPGGAQTGFAFTVSPLPAELLPGGPWGGPACSEAGCEEQPSWETAEMLGDTVTLKDTVTLRDAVMLGGVVMLGTW